MRTRNVIILILAIVLTILTLYFTYCAVNIVHLIKRVYQNPIIFVHLFLKFLKIWSWSPTHFRFSNIIIGIIHVLVYVILFLLGAILDLILFIIPTIVGSILHFFWLLICFFATSWGESYIVPNIVSYAPVLISHAITVFAILFTLIHLIVFIFDRSFEYLVGLVGFKLFKYRLLKDKESTNEGTEEVTEPSLEDMEELERTMSNNEKENLENKQDEILAEIARYQALYPEILDDSKIGNEVRGLLSDPHLKSTYDGYFAEATKRFAFKQYTKTMKLRREALSEIKFLCTELTEVHRALTDLSESAYESSIARVRNRVREKRFKSGQVEKDIEREEGLKSKKLELEEAELDTKIQEEKNKAERSNIRIEAMKREFIGKDTEKGKGQSPAQRSLQSTLDKIEVMKAKSESLDMIKKAMNDDLASTVDDEIKREKKRMWMQLFMEKMEE